MPRIPPGHPWRHDDPQELGQGSRELDRIQGNWLIAFTGGTDYRYAGLACLPLVSPSTRDEVS